MTIEKLDKIQKKRRDLEGRKSEKKARQRRRIVSFVEQAVKDVVGDANTGVVRSKVTESSLYPDTPNVSISIYGFNLFGVFFDLMPNRLTFVSDNTVFVDLRSRPMRMFPFLLRRRIRKVVEKRISEMLRYMDLSDLVGINERMKRVKGNQRDCSGCLFCGEDPFDFNECKLPFLSYTKGCAGNFRFPFVYKEKEI